MKWIDIQDLERWADTKQSQQIFPEMIRDLILQSGNIEDIRIPTRDKTALPGVDGHVECSNTALPMYLPAGKTIWEFGVSQDYEGKANDDYEKRRDNPGSLDLSDYTFVFVTPRCWAKEGSPKKENRKSITDWENEKKDEGVFKDIKYIDGVQLEAWLESIPPVASRYSRYELGNKPQSGAFSVEEFWNAYARLTDPALVEEVVLAGREDQMREIHSELLSGPGVHSWCGETSDEVAAFICASVRKSDDPDIQRFNDRCMIVDTAEAANNLLHLENFVFILHKEACSQAGELRQKNKVFCAFAVQEQHLRNAIPLNRPSPMQFADALTKMGYSENEAAIKAQSCATLILILQRILKSPGVEPPEWNQDRELLPAMMAGAWNSVNEDDKKVISKFAEEERYNNYERKILPYLKQHDRPLYREGSVWQIRAPLDAFVHLHELLTEDDWNNLKEAYVSVFSELDESYQEPSADDEYFVNNSEKFKYSNWLRKGLSTTLLVIAALHKEIDISIPGTTPQGFVNHIVNSLPGLKEDSRLLASLDDSLPYLMEAAPTPFLEALDSLLEGDGEKIRPIFVEKESYVSPVTYHTNLLWGLEVLAWDPQYLGRVSDILMRLANIDPGGRIVNRPINTLRDIYLSWLPATNASLADRMNSLKALADCYPEDTWQLILLLLPKRHDSSTGNAKPKYRLMGSETKERLTYRVVWKAQEEIVDLAIELAGNDIQKWEEIIKALSQFQPDSENVALKKKVLSGLKELIKEDFEDTENCIWAALREEINWAKNRGGIVDFEKETYEGFEKILESIEPDDPSKTVAWLFDDHLPELSERIDDEKITEQIDKARANAIKDYVETENSETLYDLAKSVKLPQFLAHAIGICEPKLSLLKNLTEKAKSDDALEDFIFGLSLVANKNFPEQWLEWVVNEYNENNLDLNSFVTLLLAFEDSQKTWKFVEELGREVEKKYWSRNRIFPYDRSENDVKILLEKCLKYSSALASISLIRHNLEHIPIEEVVDVLNKSISEINALGRNVNNLLFYDIRFILNDLFENERLDLEELASLEYAYLPVLRFNEKPKAIYALMKASSQFYMSLICSAFKKSNATDSEGEVDSDQATAAYRILMDFDEIPGESNGVIDKEYLLKWIKEAIEIGIKEDREIITLQYMGNILAHSSENAEGVWPSRPVRDIIEELRSEELETGIKVERFNMRGVYSKAIYEGGKQERDLAAKYKSWAETNVSDHRTNALLLSMAERWESDATREDERAQQDRLRELH